MPKVKEGYSLDDSYLFYKEKMIKKGVAPISKKLYREICCDYNKKVVAKALTGSMFKLPHSMGAIWIKKFKINWDKPPVDLNESKKQGKVVYHLNFHSDGWCARWAWNRLKSAAANMTFYNFTATRTNSKLVSEIMQRPNGHKIFYS